MAIKQALLREHGNDHFITPAYAVKPLVPYLNLDWTIWECTDTDGCSGIAPVLKEAGFKIECTDFDFLTHDVSEGFDCIITNPPYSKKDAFIKKCIWYNKPFALLLPITALEGVNRGRMWRSIADEFGLLVFDKRVEYSDGGVWFNTSWFTWGILPRQIIFEEL